MARDAPADGHTIFFGTISTLATNVATLAKLDMVHIPCKGAAQATAETVEGHVQMTFSQPAVMLPHGRAGRVKVLHSPEVERRLQAEESEIGGIPPEAFAARMRSEIAKWTRVVKEAGIKVE